MIQYLLDNYKDNLLGMMFAYIGIASIIVMFLPKNNIISRMFKEFASICTSIFKK
jgi:hypothetical protein